MTQSLARELIERVRQADRVVVLTGAGISAESGVPTFRDAQTGLWARYDAMQLATPEAFQRNPEFVWRWYLWRRELIAGVEPNPAHLALSRWESLKPELRVVTQNVDGLHQRAGSRRVIELHGNITRNRCTDAGHVVDVADPDSAGCPRCGARLRPDVVWFGEMLPQEAFAEAERAVGEADLVLSIGTSALVQPAASLPRRALEAGATVVELNPEPTPLSSIVHLSLRGKAGELLPRIVQSIDSGV